MDGSKPSAICVRPLGSSTSTLELVFDRLPGCVAPDGKLQKLTNVNLSAECALGESICDHIGKSPLQPEINEEGNCFVSYEF